MASTSDATAGRHRACTARRRHSAHRAALGLAVVTALSGMAAGQAVGAQQACTDSLSSLAAARFQDNGDGTVTDVETKLMWMRCAGGQQWAGLRCVGAAAVYDWAAAGQQAEVLNREGSAFYNDWRLPSLRELATITDRGCRNPRTSLAVFPGTPAAGFWSSTPRPGELAGERVLGLSFGNDGVLLARKDERLHLRLVRTGP